MVKQTAYILFFSSIILLQSCKNKDGKPDEGSVKDSDSMKVETEVKQVFTPEHPENITTDTVIKVNGKKYKLKFTQKTIDSSFVMFQRMFRGRLMQNLYADYEYFVTLTAPDGKTSNFKIIKQDFHEEFDTNYINNSVLKLYRFDGYSEFDGGFFFDFTITRPETDNTYRIKYIIDLKGTKRYEVEDIIS